MPFHKLIKGFESFQKSCFETKPELFDKLIRHGQSPEALMISCSDSRIDPAILTASDPGDLFVVRNVAAIVPPYEKDSAYHGTSAAIEYAVKVLKVKHIIVMGHALCGGVKALMDHETTNGAFDFIGPWIGIGKEGLEAAESQLGDKPAEFRQRAVEQSLALISLRNLLTFPWLRKALEEDRLTLHGWYFDLENGSLEVFDASQNRFRNVFEVPENMPGPRCEEDLDIAKLIHNM